MTENTELPVGEWVDIRATDGMVPVIGAVPDEQDSRLLRDEETGELIVWHNGRKDYRCPRKGITPEEVVFDGGGAPWCPDCYKSNQDKARLKGIFGQTVKREINDAEF